MTKQYEKIQEINNLDPIIHARARLLLMSHIYLSDRADYRFLYIQTGLSWGNLSTHMSKLEVAGYVTIKKKIIQKNKKRCGMQHKCGLQKCGMRH